MRIILSNSKGKHAINLTKYEWLKTAKKLGLLFQSPDKITVGTKTYSEGQELTLSNNKFLVTNIIPNKSISLINSKGDELHITINENNYPIEDHGKDIFNIHPSTSPSHAKNEIRKLLKNSQSLPGQSWNYGDHKIAVEYIKEDENIKKTFYVTTPEGQELEANIGPYEDNNTADLWIDAGCPQFIPPNQTNWNKKSLEEYIKTNPMWFKDTFGETHSTTKGKKFVHAILKKLKIATQYQSPPPGKEPNIFCAWCNKPLGYNEKLTMISHGMCQECFEIENSKLNQELPTKQAQNQVNVGANINNGMQPSPETPSLQQEDQMNADFQADLDAMQGFSNLQNYKKSLTAIEKTQLLSSLSQLKSTFPQMQNMVKNPQSKQYLMMFLEEMSKSPIGKVNNLKGIMQGLQHVSDQEIQIALTPASVSQQQVQQVQNVNPIGLR